MCKLRVLGPVWLGHISQNGWENTVRDDVGVMVLVMVLLSGGARKDAEVSIADAVEVV